jgi:hypothetical protein
MHSYESQTATAQDGTVNSGTPFIETPLWSRFVNLTQQHRDLDCTILALTDSGDDLLVARLKKRKLRLKDEIECVAANLRVSAAAAVS